MYGNSSTMNAQYEEREYMLRRGITEVTNSILKALEDRYASPSTRQFYSSVGETEFRADVQKAYAQMNPWVKQREIVQNARNKGIVGEEIIVDAECSVRIFVDSRGYWWCNSQRGLPDELYTYLRLFMKDHSNGIR